MHGSCCSNWLSRRSTLQSVHDNQQLVRTVLANVLFIQPSQLTHAHFSTRAISFCAACGTSRQALYLLSRKGSTGRCQERKYSGDQSSRTHGVEIAELTGVNRYDMLREDENERDCLISRPWIEESCCDTFITKLS